jgi:hypothetical protein
MRKLLAAAALALAAVFVLAGAAFTAPSNDDELLKDEQHFLQQSKKTYTGGQKAAQISPNMEVVGHTDLEGRGFNADVWFHEGYAYIGQWGFSDWAAGSKQRFCPSGDKSGVAIVDATDPSDPQMIGTLQNPDGTSAEDVVVYTAQSGPYAGRDIAAVGIQVCGGSRYDTSFQRGLQLFDVSDPSDPEEIGFFDTGCCTRGLHEFEVEHNAELGRTFAFATVPASRYPDSGTPSGVRDADGLDGDFRLIDITDPSDPFQASTWWVQQAGGPFAAQGCDPDGNFGHGAEPSHDGKLAFLAYWDSGFIALDVSDPENPEFLGRTVYDSDEDGDGHSAMYDDARQLLFTADEDFGKHCGPGIEPGYGYLRIYDLAGGFEDPPQIGEFRTLNSITGGPVGSGDYTIHNNWLNGEDVWISWYSDGVRVVDASDPANPEEIAFFVPPAGQNPVKPSQRGVLSQMPQVWGIVVDEATGLGYASDMNTGLWILDVTDPGH